MLFRRLVIELIYGYLGIAFKCFLYEEWVGVFRAWDLPCGHEMSLSSHRITVQGAEKYGEDVYMTEQFILYFKCLLSLGYWGDQLKSGEYFRV